MTLPLTTTLVKIETASGSGDRWEPAAHSVSNASVAATIGLPGPSDTETSQGSQERIDMVLYVNPGVAVTRLDRVTDLGLGEVYEVLWVLKRQGLSLDHTRAGLKRVKGA